MNTDPDADVLPALGVLGSARCTSTPHSTACPGSGKAIMNPSPWFLTTWPPRSATSFWMSLLCRSSTLTQPRSPRASLCAVESSMSENAITTSPSAVILARSGRSIWAQPARSSTEFRTVAPMPFVINESAVFHTRRTAKGATPGRRRRRPVLSLRLRSSSALAPFSCRRDTISRIASATRPPNSASAPTASSTAVVIACYPSPRSPSLAEYARHPHHRFAADLVIARSTPATTRSGWWIWTK